MFLSLHGRKISGNWNKQSWVKELNYVWADGMYGPFSSHTSSVMEKWKIFQPVSVEYRELEGKREKDNAG